MSFRQGSVFSIGSFGVSNKRNEDITFDDISTEELQQMLENVMQEIWLLTLENDVFERYLTRQNPESLKNIAQVLDRAKHTQKIMTQIAPTSSRMSISGSTSSIPDKGSPSVPSVRSGSRYATPSLLTTRTFGGNLKIPLTHRIGMARKEIDAMRSRLMRFERAAAKKKAKLRAEMEELEFRIREAYEVKNEFEEEVVEKGIDPITGKIPAEKIARFVEDWLKTADAVVERLILKSTTTKSQIKKAKQQLIQREELGEALHAVDFEQLNIENQHYVRKIEEKNHYLLDMKKITGRYGLELSKRKQKLNDLLLALDTVRKEMDMKQQQIAKLQSEHGSIKIDAENTKEQLTSLHTLMENYSVPDILDFVKLEVEVQRLTKIYKRLCRQKKIQQIMLT